MTCIVGVVDGARVVIGGDSAGVGGLSLSVRADAKVFRTGDFVMGFTSSFRMGQLLRYVLVPPKRHADQDPMEFMVRDFVGAVRDCLKAGGFATKKEEAEHGGTFLVGHAGRLFMVDADYQVGEAACCYDAVGCGADLALGALHATVGLSGAARVDLALRAAEAHSAGVRGPFHVVAL